MSLETSTIMRAVLLHVRRAKTLKEAQASIRAMCEKADIDAVEEAMKEIEANAETGK